MLRNVALLLPLALAAQQVSTPKFRWWQTTDALHLELAVRCAGEPALDVLDSIHLRFTCSDAHGAVNASLSFELREPVSSWSCQRVQSSTRCTLTKVHPHRFDRLSWVPDALRGIATVDYDRMETEDVTGSGAEDGFGPSGPFAALGFLGAAEVASARAAGETLVLDVACACRV